MRINPIIASNRQSFGANFAEKTKMQLANSGYYYLDKYGEKSEKFNLFKQNVKEMKELCPDSTISMEKVINPRTKAPGMEVSINTPDSSTRKIFYNINNPVGVFRFGIENMQDLVEDLKRIETELKTEHNPEYKAELLQDIIE